MYGRGISRPDPYDLVPYKTLDESTTPNTVNIGNPALVAEHANDYDFLYERFLPSVGMIEAGYFYKHLRPASFQDGVNDTQPVSQLRHSNRASDAVGEWRSRVCSRLELAYQQHLTFLPGVLAGARIDANITYTQSKNYDLTGRTDTPPLVGQAPFSYNITPSYATKRALVTVGISLRWPEYRRYQYQDEGQLAASQGPIRR